MKQNSAMRWFTNVSRREELLKRKTILKLFSATNDHIAMSKINITSPAIGESYSLEAKDLLLDDITISEIKSKYITCSDDSYVFGIEIEGNYETLTSDVPVTLVCLNVLDGAPYFKFDPLILHANDIENYTDTKPIATTYGRYLSNYFAIASVFKNNVIPFINDHWDIGKVEKKLAVLCSNGKVTAEEINKYIDHGYFLSSLNEVFATMLTEKSIITPESVENRRKELYAKYKDELRTDPSVMIAVENELTKLDKEAIANDPSMDFYGDSGKKIKVHRKRMNVAIGMLETFEKTKGKYDFVPGPLYEGWKVENFVPMFNEIRKGTYERGISTADGGLTTKEMNRSFQNLKITTDDCKTNRTLDIVLTENIVDDFIDQNIMIDNKTYITLTPENKKDFVGKKVRIRSMMYCEDKTGFCEVCAGARYKKLNTTNIGTIPLDLGAAFMMIPMKAMHGVSISTVHVDDIDKYVV